MIGFVDLVLDSLQMQRAFGSATRATVNLENCVLFLQDSFLEYSLQSLESRPFGVALGAEFALIMDFGST